MPLLLVLRLLSALRLSTRCPAAAQVHRHAWNRWQWLRSYHRLQLLLDLSIVSLFVSTSHPHFHHCSFRSRPRHQIHQLPPLLQPPSHPQMSLTARLKLTVSSWTHHAHYIPTHRRHPRVPRLPSSFFTRPSTFRYSSSRAHQFALILARTMNHCHRVAYLASRHSPLRRR